MHLTFVILSVTVCINIGLIAFIVQKNFRPLVSKVLVVQMTTMTLWTASIASNLWMHSDLIEMYIFFFAAISLTAQLWFVTLFPAGDNISRRTKYLLSFFTIIGLFFAIISLIPNLVVTTIAVTIHGYTSITPGPLSALYALFALVSIVTAISVLSLRYFQTQNTVVKEQARYLLYGYVLFFVITLLTNSLLPLVFSIFFFNAIGPVFSVILIAGIVYVMTWRQFLETREIAQNSFVYTALLSFVLVLYILALTISSFFFQTNSQIGQFVSCLGVTFITLVTVPKVNIYLRRKTDPFFFANEYDYQIALHTLSSIMHDSLEMDTLLKKAEESLREILQATSVRITQEFQTNNSAVLSIPIDLTGSQIGTILMGKKISGTEYTPRDLQLLSTFAHQAAIAIGRVLLYEEVKERALELEEKVVLRTQSIKDIQEKQKTAMLHISHNLQTPLSILQTKIEKLNKFPGMQKTAQGLTSSMRHMSVFVNDLLRYARIESNQEIFEKEDFNLSAKIIELVEEYEIIAESKSVNIITEITSEVYVNADERKVSEVITNLVSNALKYADTLYKPTIHLCLTKEDAYAVCTITDNGVGIAEKELDLIFEQYYRIGTNEVDGTGLGLAISKQIIDQHDGCINVESTLGEETIFTVKLPLAQSTE